VYATLAIPGSPRHLVATVTTDRAGTFSYVMSGRASQIMEFAYAVDHASGEYRDRVTTAQTVRAAVSLTLPKTARPGRSVTLSGALDVDPLPATGARVMIETKGARGWITAAIVRTRKGGTFRWSHVFRTKGSYRFRARVLPATDLPAVVDRSPERSLSVR
jgi:hypothetical protein